MKFELSSRLKPADLEVPARAVAAGLKLAFFPRGRRRAKLFIVKLQEEAKGYVRGYVDKKRVTV